MSLGSFSNDFFKLIFEVKCLLKIKSIKFIKYITETHSAIDMALEWFLMFLNSL